MRSNKQSPWRGCLCLCASAGPGPPDGGQGGCCGDPRRCNCAKPNLGRPEGNPWAQRVSALARQGQSDFTKQHWVALAVTGSGPGQQECTELCWQPQHDVDSYGSHSTGFSAHAPVGLCSTNITRLFKVVNKTDEILYNRWAWFGWQCSTALAAATWVLAPTSSAPGAALLVATLALHMFRVLEA